MIFRWLVRVKRRKKSSRENAKKSKKCFWVGFLFSLPLFAATSCLFQSQIISIILEKRGAFPGLVKRRVLFANNPAKFQTAL